MTNRLEYHVFPFQDVVIVSCLHRQFVEDYLFEQMELKEKRERMKQIFFCWCKLHSLDFFVLYNNHLVFFALIHRL